MGSAKKRTLINDFFTFMVTFRHFGPLGGGPLGALAFSWGPPRASMRSLTSIATLTPGLVQPPVQLGKFAHFWGLPKQLRQNQSNRAFYLRRVVKLQLPPRNTGNTASDRYFCRRQKHHAPLSHLIFVWIQQSTWKRREDIVQL